MRFGVESSIAVKKEAPSNVIDIGRCFVLCWVAVWAVMYSCLGRLNRNGRRLSLGGGLEKRGFSIR